jgi:regulator of nonsense transcripts 2
MVIFKTIEEAAVAVDDMIASAFQGAACESTFFECGGAELIFVVVANGDDSGDDSSTEEDSGRENATRGEEEELPSQELQVDDRAASPDPIVVLSAQENLGPSEEAEAEFAKEFAKMVADSSTESRKVDKKTALALWDSAVLPPNARPKKRLEEQDETGSHQGPGESVMNFTVITKRGTKQQVWVLPTLGRTVITTQHKQARQLPVPATSALAVHTRSAQLQDRAEQQHLKRFVLDYEQREEAEEMKGPISYTRCEFPHCPDFSLLVAFEMRNRAAGVKIRFVG